MTHFQYQQRSLVGIFLFADYAWLVSPNLWDPLPVNLDAPSQLELKKRHFSCEPHLQRQELVDDFALKNGSGNGKRKLGFWNWPCWIQTKQINQLLHQWRLEKQYQFAQPSSLLALVLNLQGLPFYHCLPDTPWCSSLCTAQA